MKELEQAKAAAKYLQESIDKKPHIGIVLGSGLGNLASSLDDVIEIPYEDIPQFPVSTVEGHRGRLIFGKLGGVEVVAMQGRFHYYEGYEMSQVTFPIRVMHFIGIDTLLLTNAAGGMNAQFQLGDLMIINDHINLFPEHPLRGKNYPELGPRFPDMHEVYSLELRNRVKDIAQESGIRVVEGVYVGTQGPTFETPAEIRYFSIIGGDAVGMSTIPEAIVAHHMGMKIFGMSIITDLDVPGRPMAPVSHEEVQEIGSRQEPIMTQLIEKLVKSIG